jgi:glycosidase
MRWTDHAIWWHVYPLGFTDAPPEAPAAGAPLTAPPAGPPAVPLTGPPAAPLTAPPAARLDRLVGWLDYAIELGCSGLALGPVFAAETHGYDTVDHFRVDSRLGDGDAFDRLVGAARDRGLRVLLDGVFHHVGRGFAQFQRALREGPESAAASWFRLRWPAAGEPDYDCFEGHRHLVSLNHASPEVAAYVRSVLCHWLDRGADGWRLDAAYAVPPEFWRAVLPAVRQRHPGAWFVGEMIHGDYRGYLAASQLDSVTQYELWKAIWSSINDRNLFELTWALERHNDFAAAFLPLTFVGNHDVTRIASRLRDERHLGHALAVLFTAAGTPSVYYGDEQAFRGLKQDRVGGDDAIRPAFPATPADLAPWGWPTYRQHQELIALRRRHPWLAHCRSRAVHLTNQQLALRCTPAPGDAGGGGEITVLLNLADHAYSFPVTGAGLVAAADEATRHSEPLSSLAPHGWAVLTS